MQLRELAGWTLAQLLALKWSRLIRPRFRSEEEKWASPWPCDGYRDESTHDFVLSYTDSANTRCESEEATKNHVEPTTSLQESLTDKLNTHFLLS